MGFLLNPYILGTSSGAAISASVGFAAGSGASLGSGEFLGIGESAGTSSGAGSTVGSGVRLATEAASGSAAGSGTATGVGFSFQTISAAGSASGIGAGSATGFAVQPYRYWRILISSVTSGTPYAAISELEMYQTVYGANVCTGGTASASSVTGGYEAADAFDGNLRDYNSGSGSAWATNYGAVSNSWLKYDFGAGNEKSIVAIGMHARAFATQAPTAFSVQYSSDDSAWTTAWSESSVSWSDFEYKLFKNPSESTPSYSGSPYGSHSYWRVFVADDMSNGVYIPCIAELAYRATPSGSNQATGGSATASSEYNGAFVASNAFDGNASTMWAPTSGSSGAWLRYDFASPVSVAQFALTIRNDGYTGNSPKAFAFQWADSSSGPWRTTVKPIGQTNWTNGETKVYTDPNYV